jgi:pilus assembly protein CpaE
MSPEVLARVLRYAVMRSRTSSEAAKAEPSRGTLAGFLGAKGGVGTTTLACQFAVELRKQSGKRVLFIDLDTSASPAAFLMKRESPYSTLDACQNLHRLDEDLWRGLVSSGGDNSVDLLQSPGAMPANDQLTSERIRHVLRFARSLYGWIVVDLGRLSSLSMDVMPEVPDVYLVTTPDLPSLYLTSRQLKRLADLGMRIDQIRLIVNRVSGGGAAASDLKTALGCPVYAELPDCAEDLAEAYAERRFMDEGLRLRRQVSKVTSRVLGIEPKAQARTPRRLFQFPRLKSADVPAK